MRGQQTGQMVFEDRHAAFTESFYLGFVIVHADDAVAHLGKANGSDQSDISGPDYTNGNRFRHTQPYLISCFGQNFVVQLVRIYMVLLGYRLQTG
jgi:hypothetical protein